MSGAKSRSRTIGEIPQVPEEWNKIPIILHKEHLYAGSDSSE